MNRAWLHNQAYYVPNKNKSPNNNKGNMNRNNVLNSKGGIVMNRLHSCGRISCMRACGFFSCSYTLWLS